MGDADGCQPGQREEHFCHTGGKAQEERFKVNIKEISLT